MFLASLLREIDKPPTQGVEFHTLIFFSYGEDMDSSSRAEVVKWAS
jgi:hypothetical protein